MESPGESYSRGGVFCKTADGMEIVFPKSDWSDCSVTGAILPGGEGVIFSNDYTKDKAITEYYEDHQHSELSNFKKALSKRTVDTEKSCEADILALLSCFNLRLFTSNLAERKVVSVSFYGSSNNMSPKLYHYFAPKSVLIRLGDVCVVTVGARYKFVMVEEVLSLEAAADVDRYPTKAIIGVVKGK